MCDPQASFLAEPEGLYETAQTDKSTQQLSTRTTGRSFNSTQDTEYCIEIIDELDKNTMPLNTLYLDPGTSR